MINLLPPPERKEIKAAYSNSLLLRYTALTGASLVFIIISLVATYVVLTQASNLADSTTKNNEQKVASFSNVQAQANSLRSDLTNAKQLFDNEIRYSKVLTNFAASLPSGAALSSITLDQNTSFTNPSTINIQIRNQTAAIALENSLQNSPFFKGVSLGSVNTNPQDNSLPYVVDVTFTLDRSIGR